jgi:hypothetical protein
MVIGNLIFGLLNIGLGIFNLLHPPVAIWLVPVNFFAAGVGCSTALGIWLVER